jgi:hypothetical protein
MEAILDARADGWRRRIEDQRHSGQSIRAWCRANAAAEHSFYWWRRRLGAGAAVEPSARKKPTKRVESSHVAFARVRVVEQPACESLRLRLGGGRELILPASMSAQQVARLLGAIEELG